VSSVVELATRLPLVGAGPPVSSRSRRFGAAPPDLLEEWGYVEEEYFVIGLGRVYRYDEDGTNVVVQANDVPYATQLLVRKPADRSRFSGNVIVETMHGGLTPGFTFGMCADLFVANGDGWAQVLQATRATEAFDAERYAPLNLTNSGQLWDILAQVGSLLKSDAAGNPFRDYGVRRVYLGGVSGSTLNTQTYLGDGFHERHRLPDGGPIYDGYVPYIAHGSLNYLQISSPIGRWTLEGLHPTMQIPLDDPRRTMQPHDVPVIQVVTEAEVIVPFSPPPVQDLMINMYLFGLPPTERDRLRYRRPDSDDPSDRYRLYEIAGAGHDASMAHAVALLHRTRDGKPGRLGLMGKPRGPLSDFPARYVLCGAYRNLYRWVEEGTPPPRAERIQVSEQTVDLVRDDHGNALGGVRTPYLDVPTATYTGSNPGAALMGMKQPFPPEELRALYGDHATYLERFGRRTDELLAEGWFLPEHAEAMKHEAEAAEELF
jgi:hypothetical protein